MSGPSGKGAAVRLTPKMKEALRRWQLRYADVRNPTAQALMKRGLADKDIE